MNSELIILLAHGSSDENWAQTFRDLTSNAAQRHSNVKLAFMELSTPSLHEIVKEGADLGYKKMSVLPLFLAKGKHLKKDVPRMAEELSRQHGVEIAIQAPIGEHPQLAMAINGIIDQQMS